MPKIVTIVRKYVLPAVIASVAATVAHAVPLDVATGAQSDADGTISNFGTYALGAASLVYGIMLAKRLIRG